MSGQSRAFLVFARTVSGWAAERHYDLVFATSSRLMTAALGARIARRQQAPLYLDIRDIFVDTIGDILKGPFSRLMSGFFSLIESRAMSRARHINLVSRGFEGYFRSRYPDADYTFFTNGVDAEFIDAARASASAVAEMDTPRGKARILYAGNLGEGQAMHTIVPELARLLHDRAEFVVIGDGGRKSALAEAVSGLENVRICDPISRPDLVAAYQDADVLLLHLARQPAFEKVLPSKVFEYAAMSKPILAGVGGFAAQFIRSEISNAAVFSPGDAADGAAAFATLKLQSTPRPDFVSRFERSGICHEMADTILALLPGA
jgi:glycosyltransferase involved in cell wall biosynthesis